MEFPVCASAMQPHRTVLFKEESPRFHQSWVNRPSEGTEFRLFPLCLVNGYHAKDASGIQRYIPATQRRTQLADGFHIHLAKIPTGVFIVRHQNRKAMDILMKL